MTDSHSHPSVDFRALAEKAVAAGIFRKTETRDPPPGSHFPYPESKLDVPYGAGPKQIKYHEKDVADKVSDAVYTNIREVAKLFDGELKTYFHERFLGEEDILQSSGMSETMRETRFWALYINPDDSVSFKTRGEGRNRVRDRHVYTEEELEAMVELVHDVPALALAVMAYQNVARDYYENIEKEFARMVGVLGSSVTEKDVENFHVVMVREWTNNNFVSNLLPAMALHIHNGAETNKEFFRNSARTMAFFGAFQNDVPVSSEVAENAQERVASFSCPLAPTIMGSLADGATLYAIYSDIEKRLQAGNEIATRQANEVRRKVAHHLENIKATRPLREAERQRRQELAEIAVPTGEAITRVLHNEEQVATFSVAGINYRISGETVEDLFVEGRPLDEDDIVLVAGADETISSICGNAVTTALREDRAVFFTYQDYPFMVTPQNVQAYLRQYAVSEAAMSELPRSSVHSVEEVLAPVRSETSPEIDTGWANNPRYRTTPNVASSEEGREGQGHGRR